MLDSAEYERWSAAAEDTLAAARTQASTEVHNWACFLAEQAAQLAVKGVLHGVGAGARGHDLVALGGALADALGSRLPDDMEHALLDLSRHYIPTRYPDALPGGTPATRYTGRDSAAAIAAADLVLAHTRSAWVQLEDAAGDG